MKSGELARLAGVTQRTLRHYHQVGVLSEPPRTANGYRDYDAEDLLRLIRIRRITAAGVPLNRVAEVLDRSEPATALLGDLETTLDIQIDALLAQREIVRHMRAGNFDPLLPAELLPAHELSTTLGIHPEVSRLDLDQASLLLHLLGPTTATYLNETMIALRSLLPQAAIVDFSTRFGELDDSSSIAAVDRLAAQSVEIFGPVIDELMIRGAVPSLSRTTHLLLEQHRNDRLNPAQQAVIQHFAATFRKIPCC